jgi:hypothetical protein
MLQCSISLRHDIPVNPESFTNPPFLIHDFLLLSTAIFAASSAPSG